MTAASPRVPAPLVTPTPIVLKPIIVLLRKSFPPPPPPLPTFLSHSAPLLPLSAPAGGCGEPDDHLSGLCGDVGILQAPLLRPLLLHVPHGEAPRAAGGSGREGGDGEWGGEG